MIAESAAMGRRVGDDLLLRSTMAIVFWASSRTQM
jgi:hypothetical protein